MSGVVSCTPDVKACSQKRIELFHTWGGKREMARAGVSGGGGRLGGCVEGTGAFGAADLRAVLLQRPPE